MTILRFSDAFVDCVVMMPETPSPMLKMNVQQGRRKRGSGGVRGWYVDGTERSRTQLAVIFSIGCLHVAVFSQHLHPATFILRAPRPFRHRGVPQLFDDLVHIFGRRLDR